MNLSRLHTQWWSDNYIHIPYIYIDLHVKHAHLYNIKHRLNSSAYRFRRLCQHSDIWTFFVRSRGCQDNRCLLYKWFLNTQIKNHNPKQLCKWQLIWLFLTSNTDFCLHFTPYFETFRLSFNTNCKTCCIIIRSQVERKLI